MTHKIKLGEMHFNIGGMGYICGKQYLSDADRDLLPPTKSIYLDTDSNLLDDAKTIFDRAKFIGLNGSQVDTIKATPERFGRGVQQALVGTAEKHFKPYQAAYGSRTFRVLTLFAFAYHLMDIIEIIHSTAVSLTKEHNVTRIRPVLVGSTGGGCGSALLVLISYLMSHPDTRWLLTKGLGVDIFEPIVVIAVDPFTHMFKHQLPHAAKIGSNCIATHIASEMLQHAFADTRSVFNVILQFAFRSAEGVVASTPEDIARMVSNALINTQLTSKELSARGTDLYEVRKMDEFYSGEDGPLLGWPHELTNPFVGPCLFSDPKLGEI